MANPPEDGVSLPFRLDRAGVFMIVALAVVVTPAVVFSSLWFLSDGLEFTSTGVLEGVAMFAVFLLGAIVIRAGVRELGGGIGVEFDELGVRQRSLAIAWDEVETLRAPNFGLLEIRGGGKQLLLRTYLFTPRTELLEFISKRTGKTAPEIGVGT